MGSGIKGLKQGGIKDHILRIRDHGLGIGISAVVHRIRDQTDSVIMIKITKKLGFWIFQFFFFFFFASRTAYYMLLALSSILACHAVVDNFRISGIRFHNCLCCLVCALDNIICTMAHIVIRLVHL